LTVSINMYLKIFFFQLCILLGVTASSQNFQIATLKYRGGGDWYANPTALPNLVAFSNRETGATISPAIATVEVGSPDLFNYPYVYLTGHGNIIFSAQEAQNLRNYLLGGGFLHVDDNYGLDRFFRREIAKVFPDAQLVELPFSHPVYHQKFSFPQGPPKIHEHDGKPPQGFGIVHEGRLLLYYSYEMDLGNGWENREVHGNPEEVRLKALRMGSNLLQYVFNRQ
jgi:hypothetical protein